MVTFALINEIFGMPEAASEHAEVMDQFLELVHWFMAALFVGWSIFFVFTLIKFRAKKCPKADYYGVRSHRSTHIEVGVVIVEVILLMGFAFPLWAQRSEEFPEGEDVLRIRAVGYQFNWDFQYPGADGYLGDVDPELIPVNPPIGLVTDDPNADDDFVVTGTLKIPVGRPVIIDVASKDVIHNLALVPMRIQQDAIPGTRAHMWFRPTRQGKWDIICGQLCGSGHTNMRAILEVVSAEEFDTWMEERAAATASQGDAASGVEPLPEWDEPYSAPDVLKELLGN